MLYDAYEVQRSLLTGASAMADIGAGLLNNPANPFAYSHMGPIMASALQVFAHASAPRGNDNPSASGNVSHSPVNFYRKLGAEPLSEWSTFRMTTVEIERLAKSTS